MSKFTDAPEVRKIADDLIPQYHSHLLSHAVRMEYVYRDDVPKSAGKEVWGKAQKIGNLNAFLAGQDEDLDEDAGPEFFVITISRPIWEQLSLPLGDKPRATISYKGQSADLDSPAAQYIAEEVARDMAGVA